MRVDGSCHCGDVRFEAEVEPNRVGVCHCVDCQIFSGSAFRVSALVAESDFSLLVGVPACYEKTSESGKPRHLYFCGRCGTHLYGATPLAGETFYSVRGGVLAQRAELPPAVQIWCDSEVPWLAQLPSARRVQRQ